MCVRHLAREQVTVGRHRVRRLMRLLGLEAIYRKPRLTVANPEHRVYPYLLRGVTIERSNQVWCADITYIPVQGGFFYLVAVMDWASRRVLAWRLSNTLDTCFCLEALAEALEGYGVPEIFNSSPVSPSPGCWKGAGYVALSRWNVASSIPVASSTMGTSSGNRFWSSMLPLPPLPDLHAVSEQAQPHPSVTTRPGSTVSVGHFSVSASGCGTYVRSRLAAFRSFENTRWKYLSCGVPLAFGSPASGCFAACSSAMRPGANVALASDGVNMTLPKEELRWCGFGAVASRDRSRSSRAARGLVAVAVGSAGELVRGQHHRLEARTRS